MKIKRMPLLGAIGSLLIIILLFTTIFAKQECSKLKETNESLTASINEQKQTIENLNTVKTSLKKNIALLEDEKASLNTQITELTEQNKQLKAKTTQTNNTANTTNTTKITKTTETTEQPKTQVTTSTQGTNLGQFKITAYCNCSKCCGKWAGGPTASGTMPQAGRTIAVDPKVIPLGTKVIIDGHTYVAEDTGSAIKGKKIDMYFSSHSEAMAWGVKSKNVSIAK